jgi:NADPH:quinone reductase-like Zn-dependent oxidoreductase
MNRRDLRRRLILAREQPRGNAARPAIEYGALSPEPTPFPLFTVLRKVLTLRGYLVHEIIGDPARREAAKTFILDGLSSGALRPAIAKTFPFDQIVEAHLYLESNQQFGKIVVTV